MKTMLKKHFRVLIQKDECLNRLRYFPQMRYLWLFWTNLFEWPIISFSNYESAYECVKQYILKYGIVNYDYQVVDNNGGIENMKYKDSTLQSLFKSVGVCVTDEGKITQVFIIKSQVDKEKYDCYIGFDLKENDIFPEGLWMIDRFALEEEKEELLNIIKNQPEWLQKLEALATKTDEMIECKVEDETKPMTYEDAVEIIETMQGIGDSWECPQGYQFKDDNGNVINATKIVLEKKKTEYPKTYEECLSVLGIYNGLPDVEIYNAKPSECELFESLIRLKRCRDAYWKLYGEEMGLGKDLSWVPDWMCIVPLYVIIYQFHAICKAEANGGTSCILAFPTKEMRDAFYENFKELIEQCKELL